MRSRGLLSSLRFPPALFLILILGFAGARETRAQGGISPEESAARALLERAILAEGEERAKLIGELADTGSPVVGKVLTAWRQGELFLTEDPAGGKIPFTRSGGSGPGARVDNGQPIEAPEAKVVDTDSRLRRSMKNTMDFLAMADLDPKVRISAIGNMGKLRDEEYLPVFQKRLAAEKDEDAREALEEAIAMTQLSDESPDVRVAAIEKLAELKAVGALDLLKEIATAEPEPVVEEEEGVAAEEESAPEAEEDADAVSEEETTAAEDAEVESEEAAETEEVSLDAMEAENESAEEGEESGEASVEAPAEEAESAEGFTIEGLQTMDELVAQIEADEARVKAAAVKAVAEIERYLKYVEVAGTAFRGLSAGSVLLVVALGLAITFGLMGVINMAHGEIMAVGAYTTYVMQNVFASGLSLTVFGLGVNLPGMNLTGAAADSYFLWSLPAAFLMAALTGVALERGVIRFLYRRPLESLLATWGISLILQQLFRLVFGANNVQVSSPAWLSGNFTIHDVTLGWNRLFVIGFAVFIVIGTWLLLTKTRLGLLIRSVMQNRQMASCMGVRTERVNMITFGLGSGLAGLAGAFLSQIGNVGPGLGKNYIVDSFMTVVTGGLGNLIGTVLAALGMGVSEQTLQSTLDPVMGRFYVLVALILFLMWKPGGIFPTRGRGLD